MIVTGILLATENWDSPMIQESLINVLVHPKEMKDLIACRKKTASQELLQIWQGSRSQFHKHFQILVCV